MVVFHSSLVSVNVLVGAAKGPPSGWCTCNVCKHYVCVCIDTHIFLSLSLYLYIYVYIYIYRYICMYIYIYIYNTCHSGGRWWVLGTAKGCLAAWGQACGLSRNICGREQNTVNHMYNCVVTNIKHDNMNNKLTKLY